MKIINKFNNKIPYLYGILLFFFGLMELSAQKHDYHWRFGHDGNDMASDSMLGRSIIDFRNYYNDDFIYYDGNSHMDFFLTCFSMADKEGSYIFSYNGTYIENAANEVMENGEDMSDSGQPHGDILIQGGLALPVPGREGVYGFFHMAWNYFQIDSKLEIAGHELHYSVIDMSKNGGLGEVIEKRKLLLSDTLDAGKLTATLHANGRDWWLLIPKHDTDQYFRILFGRDGPILLEKQSTGVGHLEGVGQAHFSPDGSKYAKFSGISNSKGNYIYLYDFDRCTGLLSNPKVYNDTTVPNQTGGISFSPDGNILYHFASHNIYQIDANSESNEGMDASRTFIADQGTFRDTIKNFIYFPRYFQGQLGPDGKIYIIGNQGRILTTISYPDELGTSCDVKQGVNMLVTLNRSSMPHFPNYRLGPLEGSLCDTLGIVNLPLSRWRADQSKEDYLEFRMVDVSDYEPTEWHWDFGDGNTSEQRHPTHSFSQTGVYEICLTVSNAHGSDTHCETFHVGTTSVGEEVVAIEVGVYPNPMQEDLFIELKDYYPREARVVLYDMQGRKVKERRIYHGSNHVYVGSLAAGMYVYRVEDGGVEVKTGKVTKI